MEVKDLIAHFATWEQVPIDVQDDVVPLLVTSDKLEVFFWPMPLDDGIYRGMMAQYEEIPYGEGEVRQHVSIHYCNKLDTSWQRLICCKELIHILDPIDVRVSSEPAFDRLIEKIILPPEMVETSDGARVWNDRIAIWQALAILFPWATRELYIEPLNNNKITIGEIANDVDLPVEYVRLVMDEMWAEQYHIFART